MGIIAGMNASSGATAGVSTRLADWFATPLGRYLLAREQAWFDRTVADIFGFQAIQVGLPECPFLAQSRVAAHWTVDLCPPAQILADPLWLPFPENSLDLIVLPHALEFTSDPHQLLREAYRAMRSEGQIVIAGFNPFSLFGAKRYFGRGLTPPWNGNFIALYRLKDWLALLGFEVTGGALDCYVPPFASETWRARFGILRGRRRSLVADRRRRVLPPCDEAGSRHAHHHPRVGAPTAKNGLARGSPAGAPVHRARSQ